jgi:AcrR family transcriptional regulator
VQTDLSGSLDYVTAQPASGQLPARERLLNAADELFYCEGVNTVGIDRVIAHAGVAKASLYTNFGSKDELIRAYLERRHNSRRERIEQAIAVWESPRDKILAVFDQLGDLRGCPFIRAGAEAPPGSPVEEANDAYRRWVRSLFQSLARDAGASDPATLAVQLQILYDGSAVGARMDRNTRAARKARMAAEVLVDAHTGSRPRGSSRGAMRA